MTHVVDADDHAKVILQVFRKLNAKPDDTVIPDYVLAQDAIKLGLTQMDYRRGLEHAKIQRWLIDTDTGGYKITELGYLKIS